MPSEVENLTENNVARTADGTMGTLFKILKKCKQKFKKIKALATIGDPKQPFHGSGTDRRSKSLEKTLYNGPRLMVLIYRLFLVVFSRHKDATLIGQNTQ